MPIWYDIELRGKEAAVIEKNAAGNLVTAGIGRTTIATLAAKSVLAAEVTMLHGDSKA